MHEPWYQLGDAPASGPLVPTGIECGWAPEKIRTIYTREKSLAPASN